MRAASNCHFDTRSAQRIDHALQRLSALDVDRRSLDAQWRGRKALVIEVAHASDQKRRQQGKHEQ
jgi:aminoglycoside phosphotransferase